MDYQIGVTPCPQCGSSDQVHTARQMFDIMNGASQPGVQQPTSFGQPTSSPQPTGFGQPAPFGQPTPFGQQDQSQQGTGFAQPAPFGQPTPFGQQDQSQQPGQSPQPGQFPQPGQPQQPGQFPQPGQSQPPGQMGGYNGPDDGDYDHYNGDGNRFGFGGNRSRRDEFGFDSVREALTDDIGGAVMGAALGFAGRAMAKRMKKAYDEKIAPAMAARAAQAQQQSQQSRVEQDAIVARYPELRSCMTDRLLFLDGGYKTIPISELTMPITLAQADAVVTRLR